MKTARQLLIILCMTPVLTGAPSLTLADSDHLEARRLLESGDVMPLQSILQKISHQYPGRVIEVELEKKHNRIVYEVELVNDNGRVYELLIDAANGEILQAKEDD